MIDDWHYPAPPSLGGNQRPTEWLLGLAEIDERRKATARAAEARQIAAWLTELGHWLRKWGFEPAQVGTHPKGGDNSLAPAPLSDAVAEGHAPERPHHDN